MGAPRVTSRLWLDALLRRVRAQGAFATIIKKGEASAGALFLVVEDMAGRASLAGPAPQVSYDVPGDGERRFEWLIRDGTREDVDARLEKEKRFDPDIWIVEIEDRAMRSFVEELDRI